MLFRSAMTTLVASVLFTGTEAFTPHGLGHRAFVGKTPLNVASAETETTTSFVDLKDTSHTLYYVPSIDDIDYDAVGVKPDTSEVVDAWELTNNKGVRVKAMARGANMVALDVDDTPYVWENIEGACYYGINSSNFPYLRGLALNGGVRFAAVCAEHGLYYDLDWEKSESIQEKSKSIIFTIKDTDENRQLASVDRVAYLNDVAKPSEPLPTGFSYNAFTKFGEEDVGMSKYPTTGMTFKFNITLAEDEDFVRLRMTVENDEDEDKQGEAWLPMTFPIDEKSKILAHQTMRWRRDEWCFEDLPNMVNWEDYADTYDTALKWPSGGIFYDFPAKEGLFHGVVTDSDAGKGVVYVCPDEVASGGLPHYTKMWSWGDKDFFLNGGGNALTQGRPASEYYEPWSSGTNFAFFQTSTFEAKKQYSWEVAILPITSGLTSEDTKDLLDVVDSEIASRPELDTLEGVRVTDVKPLTP